MWYDSCALSTAQNQWDHESSKRGGTINECGLGKNNTRPQHGGLSQDTETTQQQHCVEWASFVSWPH